MLSAEARARLEGDDPPRRKRPSVEIEFESRSVRGENPVQELARRRADARYLAALALLFPHTNTDRENCATGFPDDHPGAWCLGCSIASVFIEETEFLIGEDDDETTRNADRFRISWEGEEQDD